MYDLYMAIILLLIIFGFVPALAWGRQRWQEWQRERFIRAVRKK